MPRVYGKWCLLKAAKKYNIILDSGVALYNICQVHHVSMLACFYLLINTKHNVQLRLMGVSLVLQVIWSKVKVNIRGSPILPEGNMLLAWLRIKSFFKLLLMLYSRLLTVVLDQSIEHYYNYFRSYKQVNFIKTPPPSFHPSLISLSSLIRSFLYSLYSAGPINSSSLPAVSSICCFLLLGDAIFICEKRAGCRKVFAYFIFPHRGPLMYLCGPGRGRASDLKPCYKVEVKHEWVLCNLVHYWKAHLLLWFKHSGD